MLDPTKDYGNEYADGILPVGDGKYVTDAPKQGSVYVCRVPSGGGGAFTRGPWFVNNNTEYDINKKVAVSGTVQWDGNYSMMLNGASRVIATNDLPDDHTTGVFPVAPSDPAYQYDRNPNHIAAPMPGKVSTVAVKKGQAVKAGERLLSIEAMKMETAVYCPRDAKVKDVAVKPGSAVAAGDLLVTLEG